MENTLPKILYLGNNSFNRTNILDILTAASLEFTLSAALVDVIPEIELKIYTLVILDVDHFGDAEKIKELHPFVPIILLIDQDEHFPSSSHQRFIDDILILPVAKDLVLKRIDVVTKRVYFRTMMYVHGLEIEPRTIQVYYNSATLNLLVTEYLLFSYLSEQADTVVTKETLAAAVFFNTPNALDVIESYMTSLQNKLPLPYIEYVKTGYRFTKIEDEAFEPID